MRHKDANHLPAERCALDDLLRRIKLLEKQLGEKEREIQSLGWALLMCQKDANQSVKATWLGPADAPQGNNPVRLRLTKKCGAGF